MIDLSSLQAAVLSARKRTGLNLATRVKKGKFDIVNITYDGKKVVENLLCRELTYSEAIDEVNAI